MKNIDSIVEQYLCESTTEVFDVLGHISRTKKVKGVRQSNQTILIDKNLLPDSDSITLEDKRGHRYTRDISLEKYSDNKYVYVMI